MSRRRGTDEDAGSALVELVWLGILLHVAINHTIANGPGEVTANRLEVGEAA